MQHNGALPNKPLIMSSFVKQKIVSLLVSVGRVCTYRQSIRQLVKAKGGGQHGGADGEAGTAGIAALASRASGRIPPTLPAGNFWLLLDHQDLVVTKVTQQ